MILVTTVEGWRATLRSVRWSTVILPALVASTALVVARVIAPSDPEKLTMLGEVGLALCAVAVAFLADDPTLDAVPASPVSIRARLVARAAVMVPVVAMGWLLVLVLYAGIVPGPLHVDVAGRATAAVALGASALGLAVVSGRYATVPSPGATGIAALVAIGSLLVALPERWLHHFPSAAGFWPVAMAGALLAVAWATKEPAPA